MTTEEPTSLIERAKGRPAFLRDRGEVKTPDIIDAILASAARAAELERALRQEADDYPSTDYGRWMRCAADWLQQRANDAKKTNDE